jgi:glycosyltransferase involved in cell wall biosynthesis
MPVGLESVKPTRALQGIKGHLWEQLYLPTQLRNRLLWSPGNTGPLGVSRQVLTVHDAASLDHPEWFERKFALWYGALLPRLVHKVRAIITVSHFSKERIVQLTGVDPTRVHVISNGVETRFQPADPEVVQKTKTKFGLSTPYILSVGSLEPRKNLQMLLKAWKLGSFDGATLAVVGASGHLFPRLKFDSPPAGVRLLGSIEDEELPLLYSGAAGFVYPSLYEGFGLPPLEAMACGCPVAVSDIPAHREVYGSTARYFNPSSQEELSSGLEGLLRLDNPSLASEVRGGLEHAAKFRWESAASDTWKILQTAVTAE